MSSPGLVMVASGRLLPTTSCPPTRSCARDRLRNGAGEGPGRLSISAAPVRLSGRRLGGPMKYMLLIYGDETAMAKLNEAERAALFRDYGQFSEGIRRSGNFLAGAPLRPTPTATTVRLREGKRLVTDGPFAETREQLGGYFLIEAKDLDEAIGVATRIPAAKKGTVEIRPVIEIPGLPDALTAAEPAWTDAPR